MRWRQAFVALLVMALVAASCSSSDDPDPTPTPTPDGSSVGTIDDRSAFSIRLSQGQASSRPADAIAVVEGEPLDQARIDTVLRRLPEWTGDEGERDDFKRPPASLPPPLVGDTITQPFPIDDSLDPLDVPTGPLEVLRFQPDGEVPIAPTVTITFSQPMVPVGTLSQLDSFEVPAKLTPAVPGKWEWIGTRTLRFEHDSDLIDRLPMATSYEVEIPAGTTSATGGELANTVNFGFETPTPQVLEFGPSGDDLPLEPVFYAHFDQLVDPAEALPFIELKADGDKVAVRIATEDELLDAELSRFVDDNRLLAFRPVVPLPIDASLSIRLGPDFPSAEGPNTAPKPYSATARTYGPLRVHETHCQRPKQNAKCEPFTPVSITFTNPLDLDIFDPATVSIEPDVPDGVVAAFGSRVEIRGSFLGRTDYTIRFDTRPIDVYGQTLSGDRDADFSFGDAFARIVGPEQELVTLDPLAPSGLSVTVVNHDKLRVEIYEVSPNEFETYRDRGWEYRDERRSINIGRQISNKTVDTDAERDTPTEVFIDLDDDLDKGIGQLLVFIRSKKDFTERDPEYWNNRPILTWVQGTHIGLDRLTDGDDATLWTTDLRSGDPLDGVRVEWLGATGSATTDRDGLASMSSPGRGSWGILASSGDDRALLPAWTESQTRRDSLRWFVFDDRSLYRPGETVHLKGLVRRWTTSGDAQLALVENARDLQYRAVGPQGNVLAKGAARVSALGGFDFEIDLPENANLGSAWVELTLPGLSNNMGGAGHQFQIQEFRRPEFEVRARTESEGPYLRSEPATVAVEAEYFSGGPLPDAEVTWRVTQRDATYSPPNWEDFQFGVWVPWWLTSGPSRGGGFAEDFYFDEPFFPGPFDPGTVEEFNGRTDSSGAHYLRMDFGLDGSDLPVTVSAESQVTDVNRQVWASTTNLLIHPAELYVGLRSARTFVRQGDPLDIEAVVTNIDGEPVPGRPLLIEASRLDWRFVDGQWQEIPVDTESCRVTSTSQPVDCSFATATGGEYRIVSTVIDDEDRGNRTELTRWVSGGTGRPDRTLRQEEIALIPDADEYQPGDTAEILVQVPFSPAELLITTSRNGFESTSQLKSEDGTAVLRVPIEDLHIPALHVQVDAVGATERIDDSGQPLPDAPNRPAFAVGNLTLRVPALTRTLDVTATPAAEAAAPGEATSVGLLVVDRQGEPVAGAEVAIVVVDEAVLSLTAYQLGDPIAAFYADSGPGVWADYGRRSIVLADPDRIAGPQAPSATDGAGGNVDEESAGGSDSTSGDFAADDANERAAGSSQAPIDVRSNFDALALFAPEERTGRDGKVEVDFTLPDNLTRYRVMAIAVDGADRFGSGEANITARLPLMVRPSAPRFLNFGDTFELPLVIQNQTDEAMSVEVVVQAANLTLPDGAGRRVTVPANDRIEVRIPAEADEAGTARFRAVVASPDHADAAVIALPVYTPATAEAFATYGVVDSGAVAQPLLAPTDVFSQFGGLELNTSSTALQALTDAVIYLDHYPYRNADAYASRILAISALRDVLEAFDAEGLPSAADLNARMRTDIKELVNLQNPDGGFGTWRRFDGPSPYRSVQAVHALVEARANGYTVPTGAIDRGLSYLRDIERHIPSEWSRPTRSTLVAYALNVRKTAGQADPGTAKSLFDTYDLTVDAMAWIWPVLTDPAARASIERELANRAVETAGAATFTTNYGDDAHVLLHSDRRTDGIVLAALLTEAPDSDLVPKVVAGLMAGQSRGRWNNVQENSFILLALNSYFDTFEAQDPDFIARVWLGDLYAAEHTYEGRSTDRNFTLVPMEHLIEQGDTDIVLQKTGDGRLYYRIGLRYAPTNLDLEPLDRGFVVQRTYEAVDDPDDVRRGPDGTWHIKAGAEVRVRLTMVADSRRTEVALIDPLPAGLEPLNPALVSTPTPNPEQPVDDGPGIRPGFDSGWWWGNWFGHQNLRDDRAEAFASVVWAGSYDYTYVARATTPGEFVVPPTRAEEMYSPETFGRSAADKVIVEG
jgi:alpha-2-macroglobulin